MKYMKIEDLEKGDIIKLYAGLMGDMFAAWFIRDVAKYEIMRIESVEHFYSQAITLRASFINKNKEYISGPWSINVYEDDNYIDVVELGEEK